MPAAKTITCARPLVHLCWQARSFPQLLLAMVANMGPSIATVAELFMKRVRKLLSR